MRAPRMAAVLPLALALGAAGAVVGQELPAVDPRALLAQIDALKADLRAEADRLIKEEGAEAAVARLQAEATTDGGTAFRKLQVATLVAAMARNLGLFAAAVRQAGRARDDEIPLALARHAALIEVGDGALRGSSAYNLAWQADQAETLEGTLVRYAPVLAGLERIAPDSLDLAAVVNNLGRQYYARGDLGHALEYFGRALAIGERLEAESMEVAGWLNNVGAVHMARGELEEAERRLEGSLALTQRLEPDSLLAADSLTNLGEIDRMRGNLDRALERQQRSLRIRERLMPDSFLVADSLNNIGNVLSGRGDLEQAVGYFRRALALHEKLAPDSGGVAMCLNNLGLAYGDLGDLDQALDCHQRSLAIVDRLAPESLDVACSLHNIAGIYEERGLLDQALGLYERAIGLRERLAPQSLDLAATLDLAGGLRRRLGDVAGAVADHERSLAIEARVGLDSLEAGFTHDGLGRAREAMGDREAARREHEQAVAALERARERTGLTAEARGRFAATYSRLYTGLIGVLVRLGDAESAADAVERMRARGFLEALIERPLVTNSLDPALAARQRALDATRDGLYNELNGLGSTAPEQARVEQLTPDLARVRLDQEALVREIRGSDPRLAALQYPVPGKAADLAKSLDPGTVVLSYMVGDEATWLFVFGRGRRTSAHTIAIS
jgi:pentatricopeptide repeat protein